MIAASKNRTTSHAWRLRILMLLPRETLDELTEFKLSHHTRRDYAEKLARRMWEKDTLENHPFTDNVLAFLADKLMVFDRHFDTDIDYSLYMGHGE